MLTLGGVALYNGVNETDHRLLLKDNSAYFHPGLYALVFAIKLIDSAQSFSSYITVEPLGLHGVLLFLIPSNRVKSKIKHSSPAHNPVLKQPLLIR